MTVEDVLAELLALHLPVTEYVVVGGASLCIRGIRTTNDVDLVVTPRLFEDLAARGWRNKARPNGKTGLKFGRTEAYLDVDCDTFQISTANLFARAQMVHGVPLVDLETLASLKAGYGRAKDVRDLVLIAAHTQPAWEHAA